jgi:hypothetical protein
MDIEISYNSKFIRIDNRTVRLKNISINKIGDNHNRLLPYSLFGKCSKNYLFNRNSIYDYWTNCPIEIRIFSSDSQSNDMNLLLSYGVVIGFDDEENIYYIVNGFKIRLFDSKEEALNFSNQYKDLM